MQVVASRFRTSQTVMYLNAPVLLDHITQMDARRFITCNMVIYLIALVYPAQYYAIGCVSFSNVSYILMHQCIKINITNILLH